MPSRVPAKVDQLPAADVLAEIDAKVDFQKLEEMLMDVEETEKLAAVLEGARRSHWRKAKVAQEVQACPARSGFAPKSDQLPAVERLPPRSPHYDESPLELLKSALSLAFLLSISTPLQAQFGLKTAPSRKTSTPPFRFRGLGERAAFSRDGRQIAVGTYGEVLIVDVESKKVARGIPVK